MSVPSGESSPASQVSPASGSPRHSSRTVARSAGTIGLATMTSRILGLVREQVMAYLFGAGNVVDAFNVAYRIPNLVRDLFAEGAMSAAFVPTFTRYLTRDGKPAALRLGSHVINGLLVVTAVIVVAGIVFAEPLVWLFASDYAKVPGKFEMTVAMTRVMLPFLTLVALAAACMGMLNALDRYLVPALAPAMFNVGSILVTVLGVPLLMWLGWPIVYALPVGVVAGGVAQLVVQWPSLRREGYRYEAVLDPREPGLRRVLLLMGPGTLGLAATQINVFVNTWLATGEGTGAVSWLTYSFRLMYLPLGIFGVSIATASLPGIARRAAEQDTVGLRDTVSSSIAMMLTLNVPATVGLMVLAEPIVALLFERGAFTARDTTATAGALMFYAVGLTGYSVVKIASPTFYALGQSRTPVMVSVLSVLVNAGLNLLLVREYGYRGLAFGTSLTALLNAGLLLLLLRRQLGRLDARHLVSVLIRVGLASAAMGVAAWWLAQRLLVWLPGMALPLQIVRVGAAIAGAILVLMVGLNLLKVREFTDVVGALGARVRRMRG